MSAKNVSMDFSTKVNLDVGVIDTFDVGKYKNILVLTGAYNSPKRFEQYLEPPFKELKVKYHVFTGVPVNLTAEVVHSATNFARTKNIDLIVSCGGASPMDCGKLVSLLLAQGGSLQEYLGGKQMTPNVVPHYTVPTISGRGAEISPSAYFIVNKEKKIISSPCLVPKVTYIDPMIMTGIPKILWACVGFECFATALSAYISPNATPHSNSFATLALNHYWKFIPKLLKDPDNVQYIKEVIVSSINASIAASFTGPGEWQIRANKLCAGQNLRNGIALAMVGGDLCARLYEKNKEKFDKMREIMKSTDDIKTAIDKHIKKLGLVLPPLPQ